MNDAVPPHKTLYRWEKRQSALDQPSKPTKHDDIKTWLRQVENASSNAVETVFPRSSGRQTGKILANQAAVYAKTTDTTYTEARAILDEWMNDKLRLEAGLNDSYDEEIVQSNVRSVKQACNLSFHDDDDDDDNQLEFLREPKDLLILQDPSVYYETHDETDLVKDILHDLRSKDILTRQQLIAMEKTKSSTVDIQTKIEERHRQVKENHERMQKERELKRKQIQAKKEAEAQARLLVLKEERERALKAKQEEEMIERHVIEIRKEMHEKRLQDEEQRKHQREYGNAKLERTKAEQDRARKEEELHKLKEIALKEQQDLNEKRSQTLVDDFIRMKSLTIVQKHFSAWLNVVLERRLQMGRAGALADWKLLFQSFNWWRSIIRTKKLEEETEAHMNDMKIFTMKMQQASLHYERTLLRKSMIVWQIYIRNERISKNLKYEQETTKKKIDAFLEAASTGKLWENEQQTPTTTTTNATAITTRQQSQQIKPRKVSITTRPSSLTSRSRSAITFGDKSSLLTRTQSDIKLDDFFQTTSPHNEQEESQRAVSAGLPLATDTRRMHLDFDELSSSDEDLSKKKMREKRIRLEMGEHKSTSRVMNTFEHRYNAQMKMLKEQNRLLKDQQKMIGELKYQQDQQSLHNQIANLEALKAQQNEMEEKQRKQLITDRRHATALIQAHNRGELQKQFNTSQLDQTLTDRPTTRNDMLLANMEERARRRYTLKTERETKRRAIEEEKFVKVQQLMEEKIRQEEEEKRLKVEEAREKRRLEKERELERKHFEERLQLLNEKAVIHCRLYRMRYYGLNPLKKLILIRHQQIQTAEEHYNYIIVQRTFNVWYETIRRDIEIKTNRALEFHKHLLYRRYFTSWQRYKHQTEIAEERAERHYINHLMKNTFKIWQDYTQTEIIRLWRLDDLAKEHNVKRILKTMFIIWRQYPMERRKERGREKRLAEMRLKVKDLLPDFHGTESSSSSLNAINGSDNKT
ncbi:unnamed protein product [Rotaria sordida]|uniref:Uncharacterized protein n=1 Tax=Rotaria sordida TaxID=392033 RepID=A0A813SCA7_9BILA|nr:unnamed protein product [Rotaria sordida]